MHTSQSSQPKLLYHNYILRYQITQIEKTLKNLITQRQLQTTNSFFKQNQQYKSKTPKKKQQMIINIIQNDQPQLPQREVQHNTEASLLATQQQATNYQNYHSMQQIISKYNRNLIINHTQTLPNTASIKEAEIKQNIQSQIQELQSQISQLKENGLKSIEQSEQFLASRKFYKQPTYACNSQTQQTKWRQINYQDKQNLKEQTLTPQIQENNKEDDRMQLKQVQELEDNLESLDQNEETNQQKQKQQEQQIAEYQSSRDEEHQNQLTYDQYKLQYEQDQNIPLQQEYSNEQDLEAKANQSNLKEQKWKLQKSSSDKQLKQSKYKDQIEESYATAKQQQDNQTNHSNLLQQKDLQQQQQDSQRDQKQQYTQSNRSSIENQLESRYTPRNKPINLQAQKVDTNFDQKKQSKEVKVKKRVKQQQKKNKKKQLFTLLQPYVYKHCQFCDLLLSKGYSSASCMFCGKNDLEFDI